MDKNIYNITLQCNDILKLSKKVQTVCKRNTALSAAAIGLSAAVICLTAIVRNQEARLWELERRAYDETTF